MLEEAGATTPAMQQVTLAGIRIGSGFSTLSERFSGRLYPTKGPSAREFSSSDSRKSHIGHRQYAMMTKYIIL